MLSRELVIIDNLSSKIYLIMYANPNYTQLNQCIEIPLSLGKKITQAQHSTDEALFKSDIQKCQNYILNSDCIQVAFNQCVTLPFFDNSLSLYPSLRTTNPSPYMFYCDFDDFHIVDSSTEILVHGKHDKVVVRSLTSTRQHSKNYIKNIELEKELLSDLKEISEHVMLIDLGQNDIGRISQIGSVTVTDKMVVEEKYSHNI